MKRSVAEPFLLPPTLMGNVMCGYGASKYANVIENWLIVHY